jgi:uracil-DNA glycosylase
VSGPVSSVWDALSARIVGCTVCAELAESRTHVVPGVRPPAARLALVGEAPGAAEDLAGLPFVGRSGQWLDVALSVAGLDREEVAVVNVLKCRPPDNRKPRRSEVAACRPWLDAQLDLIDPALVVTLGGSAAEWFFGPGARIGTLRGSAHAVDGRRVLVTYHPSAALRFGPRGEPALALAADLTLAARLLGPGVAPGVGSA